MCFAEYQCPMPQVASMKVLNSPACFRRHLSIAGLIAAEIISPCLGLFVLGVT